MANNFIKFMNPLIEENCCFVVFQTPADDEVTPAAFNVTAMPFNPTFQTVNANRIGWNAAAYGIVVNGDRNRGIPVVLGNVYYVTGVDNDIAFSVTADHAKNDQSVHFKNETNSPKWMGFTLGGHLIAFKASVPPKGEIFITDSPKYNVALYCNQMTKRVDGLICSREVTFDNNQRDCVISVDFNREDLQERVAEPRHTLNVTFK